MDTQLARQVAPLRDAGRVALEAYGLMRARMTFLRSSENTTFRATDGLGGARYLLRVHRSVGGSFASLARRPAEIESELAWLEALARDTDVPVQEPLRNRAGGLVTVVEGDDGKPTCCTLLRWIEGRPFRQDATAHAGLAGRIGELAARLHRHAGAWESPPGFTRPRYGWEDVEHTASALRQGVALGLIREADHALIAAAAEVLSDGMRRLGTGSDAWGLIHADLQGSNLLVYRRGVRPIDFSLCGFGHFLFDLGCTFAWLKPHLRGAFLAGYRQARVLSEEHVGLLEGFALHAILNCFAFCVANPAHHAWLRRRMPEVANTYCRALLQGEPFLT